jgi:hypothetical protein
MFYVFIHDFKFSIPRSSELTKFSAFLKLAYLLHIDTKSTIRPCVSQLSPINTFKRSFLFINTSILKIS